MGRNNIFWPVFHFTWKNSTFKCNTDNFLKNPSSFKIKAKILFSYQIFVICFELFSFILFPRKIKCFMTPHSEKVKFPFYWSILSFFCCWVCDTWNHCNKNSIAQRRRKLITLRYIWSCQRNFNFCYDDERKFTFN